MIVTDSNLRQIFKNNGDAPQQARIQKHGVLSVSHDQIVCILQSECGQVDLVFTQRKIRDRVFVRSGHKYKDVLARSAR